MTDCMKLDPSPKLLILTVAVMVMLAGCKNPETPPAPPREESAQQEEIAELASSAKEISKLINQMTPIKSGLTKNEVMDTAKKFGDKLTIQDDPGIGMTWIQPSASLWETTMGSVPKPPMCQFYPYIGVSSSGRYWSKLKAKYCGKRWLFVNNILVMIDGDEEIIFLEKGDIDSEASGSFVSEIANLPGHTDLIHQVAKAKEVYVSMRGNHRRETWKLEEKHLDLFRRISNCLKSLDHRREHGNDSPETPTGESTSQPSDER